jgi:O-antigen ligase
MLFAAVAATLVGGILASLYGIYFIHFHGGQAFAHTGLLWIQTDEGSQVNPDHFGNSFILPASLALVGALWSRQLFKKLLYILALLVMLAAVALTGARGAMLGFLVVGIFLLIRDRHRVQLAWLGAAGGVLGAIVAGSLLASRFSTAVSSGGAGRTQIWRAGFAAFKEFWLFGAGYGNFPEAYNRFYLQVFQPLDPHFSRGSHNIFLNAGVELGIIGLALLLAGWIQTFRLLSPIAESDYRYPLRLALQASILGLFVAGIFADLMTMKYVWMAFMLTVMAYNAGPVYVSAVERRAAQMEVAPAPSA